MLLIRRKTLVAMLVMMFGFGFVACTSDEGDPDSAVENSENGNEPGAADNNGQNGPMAGQNNFAPKTVYFDFDRSDLKPEFQATLNDLAAFLKGNNANVQIEGHCDERGTVEYNLALGARRAEAVRNYLINMGVPDHRLTTISYGEEKPVDPGHNESAWAKNRRAEFTVSGM